ncbi:hypothetical protein B484DRAFT_411305, partial [Ochromonadaceae sp. CCMP2298]
SGAKTSTPKPPGPKAKSPARSKARPLTLQSHLSGTAGAASVFIPTPVTYTAATHLSAATNNIPPLGRWTEPVKFVYGASDPYAPAPKSGATASQSYTSSSDTSSSGAAAPAPVKGTGSHPAPSRGLGPGSGPPTGMNDDPDPDTRQLHTRQHLLRTSGQDLLYSEHPRTAFTTHASPGTCYVPAH